MANENDSERSKSLFLSVYEASQLLGISVPTINRHIKSGEVASTLLGGRRLVPRSFIEDLASKAIESSKTKASK
jgi:excisionase family DNA binding protein